MKLKVIGPNQTEVTFGPDCVVFFSYVTPVAAIVAGQAYRTKEKHSVTTSRHTNKWLAGRNTKTMPQEWFNMLTPQTA